jgi:arginine-tRNA-protein transferase
MQDLNNRKENHIVLEFSNLEEQCSYLKDKKQRIHYKYIQNCTTDLNSDLTKRGWRRFGNTYLRPNCADCDECKSVKIDVDNFVYTKSKRRVIKKNRETKVLLNTPTISQEKIRLYNKFHAFKNRQLGWADKTIGFENYFSSFIEGHSSHGKEVLYYIDKKLVAVDLIDFVDDGISAIYFFYDPDCISYELGKYSIYLQIHLAKSMNLKWIYLGYYVEECRSLNYKGSFKPLKTLLKNPTLSQKDIWI